MAHDIVIRGGQLVNGRVNVRDGEHTGARAGQVLRHRA